MSTKNDYSIYVYYKGNDDYPNNKARFFGGIEESFHVSYDGKEEDKEEALKDYMAHYLSEKTRDSFGGPYPLDEYYKALKHHFRLYLDKEYGVSSWG